MKYTSEEVSIITAIDNGSLKLTTPTHDEIEQIRKMAQHTQKKQIHYHPAL